jgi:hypothetical protein
MHFTQSASLTLAIALITTASAMLANAGDFVEESQISTTYNPINASGSNGKQPTSESAFSLACNSVPAAWFNPVPHVMEVCFASSNNAVNEVGTMPLGASDVNGDGITEFFDWRRDDNDNGIAIYAEGGLIIPKVLLYRSTTEVTPTTTKVWRDEVLAMNASDITSLRLSLGPNLTYMAATPRGWRDIDSDRDLDLVVSINLAYSGIQGYYRREVWFENTGNEYTPQCSGDLNQDGQVNGEDLCLVLACWTGAE